MSDKEKEFKCHFMVALTSLNSAKRSLRAFKGEDHLQVLKLQRLINDIRKFAIEYEQEGL